MISSWGVVDCINSAATNRIKRSQAERAGAN